MTQTLSAKEQPLSKIFGDDYVFSIPGYQRPYAWTTEQAGELFDDLLAYMMSGSTKLEEIAPYFLGSIVLVKREAIPEATVVDGQQRLTTLTLLLSAIRSSIADASVKAGITKRIYEQGDVVTATENHYRLSLRERDRDFFREYVQHEGGIEKLVTRTEVLPDSQARLRENARLFLAALSDLDDITKKRLAQFIATRCFLVAVATPDLDSAYRIFGVLNSRGLDLSATDILKAEIIGTIDARKRDAYTKKWEDLEEDLGRDAFGELFSHIRMVYRKAKPQGTLLKEFREHVGPKDSTQFIDTVLEPMADAFQEITDAEYSSHTAAQDVNACLHWLNRIEFKDWMPPALTFFARRRNHPNAMLAYFRDLERLAYSMLVRRTGANERIERFAELTKAVENNEELYAHDSKLQLSPEEQFETYAALSGPLYDTHAARARALILLRLDALLSGGGASYDYDTITVEHVLPQNPRESSQWLVWWPNPKDRLLWVHRLGNLALLTRKKNSAANNYDFDRKKDAYFTRGGVSPFALTTQVIRHQQWTPDVLEQRQAELLSALESHWRLDGRKNPQTIAVERLAIQAASGDATLFELESVKHHVRASAREVGDQFIVLAGSKARPNWTGHYHAYQALRQELVDTGALNVSDDDNLEFARDIPFSSPSAASAVVLGRPDNGRTSWVVRATGQTYAEWQAGVPAGANESDESQEVSGERSETLRRFWSQFINRSKGITSLYANRAPTSDNWLSGGIGRSGFGINVVVAKNRGRAECYFRLPNDSDGRTKRAFEALVAQKEAIEARFGGELDWQALPQRISARICTEIPGGWELPEESWPAFQDELIRRAERLANAMRDPIQSLEL
jgi:hypothetical protein